MAVMGGVRQAPHRLGTPPRRGAPAEGEMGAAGKVCVDPDWLGGNKAPSRLPASPLLSKNPHTQDREVAPA